MAASAGLALAIGRLITLAPSHMTIAFLTGIPARVIIGFGFLYFLSVPGQSTVRHLACGYLTFGLIAAGVNILFNARHMANIWLFFSLFYVLTVLGMSDSATATAAGRPMSDIETDRAVIQGSVVRHRLAGRPRDIMPRHPEQR